MNPSLSIFRFRSSAALVVIFALVYFIDAANINDLVPGAVVLHPDADETAGSFAQTAYSSPTSSNSLDQSVSIPTPQPSKTSDFRIVIDQDSPSVAPECLVSSLSADVLVQHDQLFIDSYRNCSLRYLVNCSLLI
jgi:hypothetical protein